MIIFLTSLKYGVLKYLLTLISSNFHTYIVSKQPPFARDKVIKKL